MISHQSRVGGGRFCVGVLAVRFFSCFSTLQFSYSYRQLFVSTAFLFLLQFPCFLLFPTLSFLSCLLPFLPLSVSPAFMNYLDSSFLHKLSFRLIGYATLRRDLGCTTPSFITSTLRHTNTSPPPLPCPSAPPPPPRQLTHHTCHPLAKLRTPQHPSYPCAKTPPVRVQLPLPTHQRCCEGDQSFFGLTIYQL